LKIGGRKRRAGKQHDRILLPLGYEPIHDAALVEHLQGAGMQTTGPRAGDRLVGAPFEDRDLDTRQRELRGQGESRRAAPDDQYVMFALECFHGAIVIPRRGRARQIARVFCQERSAAAA
jgi:hypothetical protein